MVGCRAQTRISAASESHFIVGRLSDAVESSLDFKSSRSHLEVSCSLEVDWCMATALSGQLTPASFEYGLHSTLSEAWRPSGALKVTAANKDGVSCAVDGALKKLI